MKLPTAVFAASLLCSAARAGAPAPDLDLEITYTSRVVTAEGVTRESRYDERVLRRPGHVWIERIIPAVVAGDGHAGAADGAHEHKHFNHVVIPRHVLIDDKKPRLEHVDAVNKLVIAIPPSEYGNVNFDGSFDNSFYLLDPKRVFAMALSARASQLPSARWREVEQNGVFQRVLWDEQKQVALTIESGDKAGTFYRRVDVRPQPRLRGDLPWNKLKGYGHKEYSDFLD